MEPAANTTRIPAPAQSPRPSLTPRLEQALDAAKRVSEQHVSAVPEDALTETYRRMTASAKDVPDETQLQLAVDETTGRVIGRIVDQNSGEVVKQIPSPEMLQLIAKTKELFGQLVNEKV